VRNDPENGDKKFSAPPAHGWEGILFVGENPGPGTNIDASNVGQLSNRNLGPDATIVLNSCNAGRGGKNSIAQIVANQLRRPTIGYNQSTFFGGKSCPKYSRPSDRAPDKPPVQMCPQGGVKPITFNPQ
jgi:hypothetical protein